METTIIKNTENTPRRPQKRQTATKINIAYLKSGQYIEQNDWNPNYVQTSFGKIYRTNIIGIVVSVNPGNNSISIDDSSGILTAMCGFTNNNYNIETLRSGDIIKIIGRPRSFNSDIYLAAEIIKKIDDVKWLKVRELELIHSNNQYNNNLDISADDINNNDTSIKENTNQEDSIDSDINDSESTSFTQNIDNKQSNDIEASQTTESNFDENISNEDVEKEEINDSYEIVYNMIKEKDNGSGVDIEEIVSELSKKNFDSAESLIQKLLEHGEIFEIMPGKIKLLE